jgi:predicted permease
MTDTPSFDSDRRGLGLWSGFESLWRDVRLALRSFLRNPGFTALTLIVLGATIGLNTTLFTVFNSIAMRPWAVRKPSEVVNLFRARVNATTGPDAAGGFSLEEFRYFGQHSRTMSGFIAMQDADDLLLGESERPVKASYVNGTYFKVLGIEMAKGRSFAAEEDRLDAPQPVVVLGYHAWTNTFGSDPEIIGKDIRLGSTPFRVVGVVSPEFGGTNPTRTDLWIPFAAMPLLRPLDGSVRSLLKDADACCVAVAGRRAPGVGEDQARAELNLLDRQFTTQYKQKDRKILVTGTAFLSNPGAKRALIIPAFGLLFVGVLVILLLACANIGSLLLARAAARRRDVAIRTALGASRARLFRHFMTEHLMLAFAAGLVGLWVASVLPSYLMNDVFGQSLTLQLRPDVAVFVYTFGVAVLACLAFGLLPALQGTRLEADEVLREHTATSSVRLRARNVLLAIQVTASVVLLVSAALLARGLSHAQTQDPGFAVRDVTVVSFELPSRAYEGARVQSFFTTLDQDLAQTSLAGVFAFASHEPFGARQSQVGCHTTEPLDRALLYVNVSPTYFDVLRLPLVAGRGFRRGEASTSIIVNQTVAQQYWHGQNPIGRTLTCGGQARQVVGVARDAYLSGLDRIEPAVFDTSAAQRPAQLLVRRAESETMALLTAVVKRHDDRVTLHAMPLSGVLDRSLAPTKSITALAGVLGVYALILATVGMFGVFAYVVQQRASELGIRIALGATPAQVIRGVLASTARAVAVGVVVGVVLAGLASRLLIRYLYGMSPLDPIAYVMAIVAVAGAALAASYLPARRATRLDPVATLRYQ